MDRIFAENRREFIQYKKVWTLTACSNEDQNKTWTDIITRKIEQKHKLRMFSKYLRYAAILLVTLSIGALSHYFLSDEFLKKIEYEADTRIEVPAGQISNVTLPDGTTVQLNSGSTLLYSGNFNLGERLVSLEGEAFFNVAKDPKHPFLVQTKSLDFKVYGTSFNIQAYSDEREINTTLVEGSLGVWGKNGKEFTRLVPGESVKYKSDTKELLVSKVKTDLYTSWKDGLITFRNESLKDIARKIERWYNVEIIIQNEKLANELYMGTIMRNKPVDQILEVFRLTSSLKYRIIQRPDKPSLIYWE